MPDPTEVRYIRPRELKARYGIDRVTAWRWSREGKKRIPSGHSAFAEH